VAREPDGDDWVWRVSIADVSADGPFSALPGVDRWIAVATGAGMALTVDGVDVEVTAESPAFAFDGGAATTCRLLDGPVQDLNVMVRRGGAAGAMEVVWLDGPRSLDGVTVSVVLDGAVAIGGERLEAHDAAIGEVGVVEPLGRARVALISVG
jgi:environmental stress-induced protein Ves